MHIRSHDGGEGKIHMIIISHSRLSLYVALLFCFQYSRLGGSSMACGSMTPEMMGAFGLTLWKGVRERLRGRAHTSGR